MSRDVATSVSNVVPGENVCRSKELEVIPQTQMDSYWLERVGILVGEKTGISLAIVGRNANVILKLVEQ